jgi:hypothetical protein
MVGGGLPSSDHRCVPYAAPAEPPQDVIEFIEYGEIGHAIESVPPDR